LLLFLHEVTGKQENRGMTEKEEDIGESICGVFSAKYNTTGG
jgi:hypothetical protein